MTATAQLVPTAVVQGPGAGPFPVHHDQALTIADLLAGPGVADGVTRLWWLGQAGFAIRHGVQVLLIDPYLSDSLAVKYAGTRFPHTRLHPSPVAPEALKDVVGVLHTHAHTDHMDPGTIPAVLSSNRPTFVAPRARRAIALERGIPAERLTGVDAGDGVQIGPFAVTAVPAAHEELTRDADGAHHFLGYVIDTGTVRIYHSGDCVPFAGQADLIAGMGVDVALLPVNGRDRHRLANGVPGNFTTVEAAELCVAAGIPALVCHHFGLFDFNTIAPGDAVAALSAAPEGLTWTVPAVGAGFELRGVQS